MATLNKVACEAMLEIGVNACTDVSGFGLGGHLCEMALGSKVQIRVHLPAVPVYPVTIELFKKGLRTGVTMSNKQSTASCVKFEEELAREREMILYDPQTSGPLAISVAAEKADSLVSLLHERGVRDAVVIADVEASPVSGLLVTDLP
jgi:selenide, water dikinase